MDVLLNQQDRTSGHIVQAFENLKKLGLLLLAIGQANITFGVVEAKLAVLDEKWRKFQETDSNLEDTASAEDRKSNDGGTATKTSSGNSQLQKIDLKKFSGEFTDWQSYRDLFVAMVGDNASLTPIEKMHYLKTSLTDEPEALIASLPPTADNLEAAWKTLKDRYENTRILTTAHIANIINLNSVKSESSKELKLLFNGTVNAVSALSALGRPTEGYDDFLMYLTVQKLDNQSRREWETSLGAKKVPPTFKELQTFFEARICAVQALEPSSSKVTAPTKSSTNPLKKDFKKNQIKSHQASKPSESSSVPSKHCSFCGQCHYIAFCDSFKSKSANERHTFVTEKRLCFNCFGNHAVKDCRSSKTCQRCNAKHHTMIHDAINSSGTITPSPPSSQRSTNQQPSTSSDSQVHAHNAQCYSADLQARILLATAVVNVFTAGGQLIGVRALLDQSSEASFVSESLVQRLKLSRSSASVAITGIGGKSATTTRGRVSLTISSRFDSTKKFVVDAFVLSQLTAYSPPRCNSDRHWHHLHGLALADPDMTSNLKIYISLGADVFSELLLPEVRKGAINAPIAQNTLLGWILFGRTTLQHEASSSYSSFQLSIDNSLSSALQRFWEQEEISHQLPLSPDEQLCEDFFKSTHSRNSEGRYIVRLPLTQNITNLDDSFSAASRMLTRMQRRFKIDSKFGSAFSEFMTEYEKLQHMEVVPEDSDEPSLIYYLPHLGVIRESSETTKLRVVFNGSKKTTRDVSLNEFFHIGQKLLPDLVDVITRWRRHAVVFSADMEKMYRQVLVHPSDRDLQRVLWQSDESSPPRKYRLTTVTYGLACAPFLAIRVIRQLALDDQVRCPRGSSSLLADVYVDDLLSGADDVASALSMQLEIIELLKAGGFALRKWTSNAPELLTHLPPTFLAHETSVNVPSDSAFHMLELS